MLVSQARNNKVVPAKLYKQITNTYPTALRVLLDR